MASSYTTADYQQMIGVIQFALAHGSHLGDNDLVKIEQMLQDASSNIVGIQAVPANPPVDGTPVAGTGDIPG